MSLFHRTQGQGPPLVLLHGWAMHSGVFGPLVEALAGDFELHLVDLPGHGRSGDSPVPLALREAAAASPRFVRGEDWPAGMDPAVFRGFGSELGRDYRGTLDRFLMLEAQGSDHVREELRLLRAEVFAHGEPGEAVLRDGLALLENTDLRDALTELSMPSLWLAGRRDRLVSPAAMQAAAALAPEARFHEVARGGHAPFLTHASEVAQALRAFAADCPP